MKYFLSLFFVVCVLTSCSNKDEVAVIQTKSDILKYIADNNLNAIERSSGLFYVVKNEGTGARPTSTSNVTVAYKGQLLNGTVFQESNANGISFPLNGVIAGWTEGIPLFKEGGEGTLIIPYYLGYGLQGSRSIPGGAALVFDIKLIKVN